MPSRRARHHASSAGAAPGATIIARGAGLGALLAPAVLVLAPRAPFVAPDQRRLLGRVRAHASGHPEWTGGHLGVHADASRWTRVSWDGRSGGKADGTGVLDGSGCPSHRTPEWTPWDGRRPRPGMAGACWVGGLAFAAAAVTLAPGPAGRLARTVLVLVAVPVPSRAARRALGG